jgi:virulence-associated protein VapD
MAINTYDIKQELINFVRNQDIISISERGVTTATETFNGDNTTVNFDLSNTNLKNVREVIVDTVTLSYGTDYSVDFDGSNPGRITFTTAPSTGTNNISVEYDYGNSDRIYPDYPRPDLTLSSYPRIALEISQINSNDFGIGGTDTISNLNIECVIFDVNVKPLEDKTTDLRNAFRTNQKNFYNFQFIHPTLVGPVIKPTDRSDEILNKNLTFQILNEVET